MKIEPNVIKASWQAWLTTERAPGTGPAWLVWGWTGVFSAVVALPFAIIGKLANGPQTGWLNGAMLEWYARTFVVSLCIGVAIQLLFAASRRLGVAARDVRAWPAYKRWLYYTVLPLAGVAIAWPLGMRLAGFSVDWAHVDIGSSVALSLLLTLLFQVWFSARTRQALAERRAAEAQLRLLQGQIEPHFLFNTLATVQALMDHDTARARRMLESFTDYLRSSLGALRRSEATLGDELDLVDAYLNLMQMRMEDRLHYEIRADIALREASLPPLALQPLVENAIHHGLEPKREGGSVQVNVRADAGRLVVEVVDDGLGLGAPPRRRPGAGVALANLRERLAGLYGGDAALELADAHPGTRATLSLPLSRGAA